MELCSHHSANKRSHAIVLQFLEEDRLVLGNVDQLRLEVLEELLLRGAHGPEDVEDDGEQEGHHEEQHGVAEVQHELEEGAFYFTLDPG